MTRKSHSKQGKPWVKTYPLWDTGAFYPEFPKFPCLVRTTRDLPDGTFVDMAIHIAGITPMNSHAHGVSIERLDEVQSPEISSRAMLKKTAAHGHFQCSEAIPILFFARIKSGSRVESQHTPKANRLVNYLFWSAKPVTLTTDAAPEFGVIKIPALCRPLPTGANLIIKVQVSPAVNPAVRQPPPEASE